ncbi:MAG: tol-pal system-associated acyl-CoA thioesterase [Thauera phenolivorans]|uniref:Tol-pal system-associated acyl-CoA thioesterase n=1 Tax=Thauera phenolivorans TaxID=1792543 RepID=A0A7X7LYH1_9RHOO|nr:tol-pal system-associated acyl-CoA thioesterase [Thauera phenolivorans]NLF55726.1 tol-pal system-associated acyl-CoA thioesterase [Thauera phenolivorans]
MHITSAPAADQPAPAVFRWPVRVYYEDTDAGGVVYYANYLRFCERARTEWLRALGVAQQRLLSEQGIGFVVRAMEADYFVSARLDDELQVVSTIVGLRRASLAFRQEVVRGDERLFAATIRVACVDLRRQKPVSIPSSLHDLLKAQTPV